MKAAAAFSRPALLAVAIAATACSAAPAPRDASSQQRLNPEEVEAWGKTERVEQGTSGVAGIQTGILRGTPSGPGLYTILLRVPAHTTIQAHEHPDDRVATVLSGTWHFGYGDRFDEAKLKALPPGSVYAEPPGMNHFARTLDTPVVVLITGVGPTDTRYVDPGADPRAAAQPTSASK
jgi:quercetin dioxygenase-like cupin family protein